MRTAVIGLGVIGRVHMEVLRAQGKEIAAVCDTDGKKSELFPEIGYYPDYRKMIDEAKPDVIHICTPHYLHAEMAIYALERGVNVLCEKPLCITEAEIKKILEAEAASSAKLGVVFQNRYNPANMYVKELLKNKKVCGAFAVVPWNRDAEYYAQAEWRGTKSMEGGGVLINQAIHTLDLLEWFCGVPEYVVSSVSNLTLQKEVEVEDTVCALYSGDANFSLFATNGSKCTFEPEITLLTERETVRVVSDQVTVNGENVKFGRNLRTYGKGCYGSGHETLIADFYDCLETGRPFPIDGKEGAKAVRLVLAAYESNGEKIEI